MKDFPGTKQKRIEIRDQHLAAVKTNTAVKAGGKCCESRFIGNFVFHVGKRAIF